MVLRLLEVLSAKISDVSDLDVAKELSEVYEKVTTAVATLSRKYWGLVKTLAAVEQERDIFIQNRSFYCGVCDEAFSSCEDFKYHLGTEEHKDEVMYDNVKVRLSNIS